MTKNIAVLDETGKKIGETYPKRARGMVKSGKAYYVGENAVRFAAALSANDTERMKSDKMNESTNVTPEAILAKVDALLAECEALRKKAYDCIEKADSEWKAESAVAMAKEQEKTTREALSFYRAAYTNMMISSDEFQEMLAEEEAEESETE